MFRVNRIVLRVASKNLMLLCMSSGRIEYLGRLLDGREDFSSNIAVKGGATVDQRGVAA